MKRVCCKILALVMTLGLVLPAVTVEASALSVTASAAVIMDYETGEILYAKDIDSWRVPASMTKIMTAYIIFEEIEKGNLTMDTPITVTQTAATISRDKSYPAAVPLKAGSTMTVEHALRLILLPSASATCYLMAEEISGTEAAFAERMNETAREMGIQADFKNSHGAHTHYTTCWSVAELVRQTIDRFPQILGFTSLKSFVHDGTTYTNTNLLLSSSYFEGADGFKTGTTDAAGYCLSATAVRDGRRIIAVLMNSKNATTRYTDATALLNYGFEELARRDAAKEATQVTLAKTPDTLRRNADHSITVKLSGVSAEYQASGELLVNGQLVQEVNSFTVTDGKELSLKTYLAPEYSQDSATITFNLVMPDGSKKEASKTIAVSSQDAAPYRDVHNHWAEEAMTELTELGVFSGDEKGYFQPEDGMTRGMFVTVLGRTAEKLGIDTRVTGAVTQFSDVPSNQYYSNYVAWAASTGLVQGYKDKFSPEEPISREEIASILHRFSIQNGITLSGTARTQFADANEISDWALDSVTATTQAGLLSGYENGTFQPLRTANRGEAARILYLYLDLAGYEAEAADDVDVAESASDDELADSADESDLDAKDEDAGQKADQKEDEAEAA